MKIKKTLSTKVDAEGRCEIYLYAYAKVNGKSHHLSAKSEVYTLPVFFDGDGIDLNKKRVITPDVRKFHTEQQKKLNGILTAISEAETAVGKDKSVMVGDWLKNVVERHLHPERFLTKEELAAQEKANKTFYDFADEYITKADFSDDLKKHLRTLTRLIARFEGYTKATIDKDFSFDCETIDHNTIDDLVDYARDEKMLADENPKLFQKLFANYPLSVTAGNRKIEERGKNCVIKMMKRLKTMWKWFVDTERVTNDPFKGWKNETEKYGTPYLLTIEERNQLLAAPMPTKHLETQRDIFVAQCFIGCRVSDLMRLQDGNITGDFIEYIPRKTKDEGDKPVVARVPIHPTLAALIKKYDGVDRKGRLFPCISDVKYNKAIKDVFTEAGITRKVEIKDSKTGNLVLRPLNEIATSHLARRTFIGNAYNKVKDPNLIAKMSGHVENSKAFARYRRIDDDALKDVVAMLG